MDPYKKGADLQHCLKVFTFISVAEFSDRNDLINEEVIDRAAYHYNRPYYPGPVPPPPPPIVPVPPTPVPVHPVYGYKYQVQKRMKQNCMHGFIKINAPFSFSLSQRKN